MFQGGNVIIGVNLGCYFVLRHYLGPGCYLGSCMDGRNSFPTGVLVQVHVRQWHDGLPSGIQIFHSCAWPPTLAQTWSTKWIKSDVLYLGVYVESGCY